MGKLKTSDFDYKLPKKFIANDPLSTRDSSKLMVYSSSTDEIFHKRFHEIVKFLRKGDVLVVNRSKVSSARIVFNGKEVFVLGKMKSGLYLTLVKPGRWFKVGRTFDLGKITAEVREVLEDGSRLIKLTGVKNLDEYLEEIGEPPFPPYIKNSKADFSQYQTVYAREKGSVAAPTAGLHFTQRLLAEIRAKGVKIEEILLHVGRGTFLPVSSEHIDDHKMHSEFFQVSADTAYALNLAKKEGRRIIAVGTTSARVLESIFTTTRGFIPKTGETDIFIYPGKYKWRAVDALITNFHLPKSTLIMLVASFLENKDVEDPVKKILDLYQLAKEEDYRFYSFGDAMFLV